MDASPPRPPSPPAQSGPSTKAEEPRGLSQADHRFAEQAAWGGLFAIEASRLALDKDTSPEVRDIANTMIADHGTANRALQSILQLRGASMPAGLDPEDEARLKELQDLQGPPFEARYKTLLVEAHESAIRLFEAAARDCDDKDLRAFAESTLPTLRKHRGHIES